MLSLFLVKWLKLPLRYVFVDLQLVVRHPDEPLHKFEWGSLNMLMGDYMKAEECFRDAVSTQQLHQPRLEIIYA